MSQCDPSSESLAEFLEARRGDITRKWEERVREVGSPADLSGSELVDTLPELLAALVKVLRGRQAPASSTRPGSVNLLVGSHGDLGYRVGPAITTVVREYWLLRDVIFEVLQEAPCPFAPETLRSLTDSLAAAMAEAVRGYVCGHEGGLSPEHERDVAESELRYRLATLATSDTVWDWDLGTNQVHWSENIHRLTGLAPGKVDPAFDWWEAHVHPEDRERVARGLQVVVASGGAHWMDEYRFRRGDGSYAFINDRGYVVRDARGRAVRMVGAMQDITQRRMEEEEARRRAEFERHLIGIVSHDLRNPLNAISMAATLLLGKGGLEEQGLRSVDRILSSANRATRMLRDLLDFTQARLGSGIPVEPRSLDLHELARQVVEEVQTTNPQRRLVLEQRGEGRGRWDADRLVQLITNLMNNALTYGSPHCAVRLRTRGMRDTVAISVHNEGAPIPAELMPRLFQPLERGDGTNARGSHSIGLGLFIVKHIVDAHGGNISVRSSELHGTTFTVRLPRLLSPAPPPPQP